MLWSNQKHQPLLEEMDAPGAPLGVRTISDRWEIDDDASLHCSLHGAVKKGRNRQTGETVAIKEYDYQWSLHNGGRKQFSNWREFKYRCVQEAHILSIAKGHAHIVQFHEYVVDDQLKRVYLVMEYLDGYIPLNEYFRVIHKRLMNCASGVARERFAKEIIRQIVSALGFLHSHFLCHHDLGLENIMVHVGTREQFRHRRRRVSPFHFEHKRWQCPHVKLIDFQEASVYYDNDTTKFLYNTNGPRLFLPNEVKCNMAHIGSAPDVFALGIITYMLATGYHPKLNYGPAKLSDSRLKKWYDDPNLTGKEWFLRFPFMTDALYTFLQRSMRSKHLKRANIHELAKHPFLNSTVQPVPNHTVPEYQPHYYNEPSRFFRIHNLYPPIDYQLPERHAQKLASPFDIEPRVLDELRQGYWGWGTAFDAEELCMDYVIHTVLEELVAWETEDDLEVFVRGYDDSACAWDDAQYAEWEADKERLRAVYAKASKPQPETWYFKTPQAALYYVVRDKLEQQENSARGVEAVVDAVVEAPVPISNVQPTTTIATTAQVPVTQLPLADSRRSSDTNASQPTAIEEDTSTPDYATLKRVSMDSQQTASTSAVEKQPLKDMKNARLGRRWFPAWKFRTADNPTLGSIVIEQ